MHILRSIYTTFKIAIGIKKNITNYLRKAIITVAFFIFTKKQLNEIIYFKCGISYDIIL